MMREFTVEVDGYSKPVKHHDHTGKKAIADIAQSIAEDEIEDLLWDKYDVEDGQEYNNCVQVTSKLGESWVFDIESTASVTKYFNHEIKLKKSPEKEICKHTLDIFGGEDE